jgi:phage baseplate assembly protein W
LDLNFIPHPVTGDVSPITDATAVKRSIKSLVLTSFYERPYQPDLGCAISQSLFENMGQLTSEIIKDSIVDVLTKYEPRAQDLVVIVSPDYDNNRYSVTVQFSIANLVEPVAVTIFLERLR